MKRIVVSCALLVALAATAVAQADEKFQFVDADGNVIPSGTTIRVSELIEDEFLGNNLNSGLFVKNVTDEQLYVSMAYEVVSIDNGMFQICFPVTCNSQMSPGLYETAAGPLEAGVSSDVQSEWFPETYGSCTVRFQVQEMQQTGFFPKQTWTKVADGPTVTVLFEYADPAAISTATRDVLAPSAGRCYDLQGRLVAQDSRAKGLRIARLPDGTTRKTVWR